MKKKILIIGNEANAYALAKKLSETNDIYVTPSSDTLREFATCLDIRENSINELLEFVMENDIDMTIPVSEKSISSNIVSKFAENKLQIFAPPAAAGELAVNKICAKKTLYKLRIPTPKFGIFEKQNLALDYIKNLKAPFVIKTNDSNSAVIVTSLQTAKNIIESVFVDKNARVIIENYIYGKPFSFYTLTDGYKAIPIGSSLTYKYALEGDGGQLTKGMGSCVPNYKLSLDHEYYIMNNVIYPTLDFLEIGGTPYLGILGVNGIISDDNQIYTLGWHTFMQDCDSSSVLQNIDENLYDLFESCIIGSFSDEVDSIKLKEQYSISLALACKNKSNTNNVIHGIETLDEDITITYYPTVKKNKYLEYEAKNGQVLILTGAGSTVSSASAKVYREADDIDFIGKSYRKDICRIN